MADTQRYCLTASLKLTDHQKIDIGNVVALLQKAECEKIDAQLDECMKFCHAHTDLVLSQHGGAMAALSDGVINKMASLFDHNEVDELNDKKDRIKSRLFRNLTERLLGQLPVEAARRTSSESDKAVWRCQACLQLMTAESSPRIKCLVNRVVLDRHGNTMPRHEKDVRWDVTSYVRDVYFRNRSWRHVYWSLWAQLTCLTCDKCGLTFPSHRMGHCLHHPEAASYAVDHDKGVTAPIGIFPCCQQVACKFDPWENLSKGCTDRDHVVNPKDPATHAKLQDLLLRRDLILDTLSANEITDGLTGNSSAAQCAAAGAGTAKTAARQAFNASVLEAARRCAAASAAKSVVGGDVTSGVRKTPSDNEDGSEQKEEQASEESDSSDTDGESGSSSETEDDVTLFDLPTVAPPPAPPVQQQQRANPTPDAEISTGQQKAANKWPVVWDVSRSRRYNHDVLRDYEQRRFQEIVAQINKQQGKINSDQEMSGLYKTQSQVSRGGIFERLALEWKAARTAPLTVAPFPQRVGVMAIARFKRTKKLLTVNTTQP